MIDSLASQPQDGVEIIIADSSGVSHLTLKNLPSCARIISLPSETCLLSARYAAFAEAHGEFSLLLDATRPVIEGGLDVMRQITAGFNLVVALESPIASTYWARLGKLDKELTSSSQMVSYSLAHRAGMVLPRIFSSAILRESFTRLRRELGIAIFNRITYGDHHLISYYPLLSAEAVGVTDRAILAHFEDASFVQILAKYHSYGRSFRVLRHVRNFPEVTSTLAHRRNWAGVAISKRLRLQPLYLARGVSFLAGQLGI